MVTINPYLNFAGNTEEAFDFCRSIFGGNYATLQRFKDTPQAGGIGPHDGEKIMHVSLPVGGKNTLMATDSLESMGQKLTVGNNISLLIEVGNKKAADVIFKGLSAGGKVSTPLADAFWGAYFGMVTDRFGIHWMVNYRYPKQTT